MKITFKHETVSDKRMLAGALSHILRKTTHYLGKPGAEYEIGGYRITKAGNIIVPGGASEADVNKLLAKLDQRGFTGTVADGKE